MLQFRLGLIWIQYSLNAYLWKSFSNMSPNKGISLYIQRASIFILIPSSSSFMSGMFFIGFFRILHKTLFVIFPRFIDVILNCIAIFYGFIVFFLLLVSLNCYIAWVIPRIWDCWVLYGFHPSYHVIVDTATSWMTWKEKKKLINVKYQLWPYYNSPLNWGFHCRRILSGNVIKPFITLFWHESLSRGKWQFASCKQINRD